MWTAGNLSQIMPPVKETDPETGMISTEPATEHTIHLLLVDDEESFRTATAKRLRLRGLQVSEAADGEQADAYLGDHVPDVVICDLKMPRLDGPAFYRSVEATAPALARKVIFVTGDVAGTDAERFLEGTGCRWLAKPFRLRDLLRVAREVIA